MVKEKKTSKHRESGKEEKKHFQKQAEAKLKASSKEREAGKGNTYGSDFGNLKEAGKSKAGERGVGNDNKAEEGNSSTPDLGNFGGTGMRNPDLSGSLGKVAIGKGCLSSIIGLVIVVGLILIF
jgi:hypothetical protein